MPIDPRLKTTITLPESVIWLLRERRVQKRIASDSEAIEAAIRYWYDAQLDLPENLSQIPVEFEGEKLTEPTRKLIRILIAILSSGKEDAIRAVRANLYVLYRYCGTDVHSATPGEKV